MANINELALVDIQKNPVLPSAERLAQMQEQMKDMDFIAFGNISLVNGASVFNVTAPGANEPETEKEVVGVIAENVAENVRWEDEYGKGDTKPPVCTGRSTKEGTMEGLNAETGEIIQCASCPYNQFGSAGDGKAGKACRNGRRLYILRNGRPLPLVFILPPTALRAFDNYRSRLFDEGQLPYSVVTRITVKVQKSKGDTGYSTPVFEPVGIVPPEEAERLHEYAKQFSESVKMEPAPEVKRTLPMDGDTVVDSAAVDAAFATLDRIFKEVDDSELPGEFEKL